VGFEFTIAASERTKTVHALDRSATVTVFFFGATAPIWALAYLHETLHFGLLDLRHSVGLLGRVISSSQDLYLYTTQKNANTHQTSMPRVGIEPRSGIRASENSACLRPPDYSDRHRKITHRKYTALLTMKMNAVVSSETLIEISTRFATREQSSCPTPRELQISWDVT
jgi:hypothetical protein